MSFTDDPLKDFERYDAEQEEAFSKLPTCDYCGDVVYDDFVRLITGELICQDCLDEEFEKDVEDYAG